MKSRDDSQCRPVRASIQRHVDHRFIPEGTVALYGFLLNVLWEFSHSALYVDHFQRNVSYILWTRFHCSIGDVLILLGSFWWTALWFRTRFWFLRNRYYLPAILFVLSGFAYTGWSEWYNTRVTQAWSYSQTMPTVFGIGISPIAQWLILPPLLVLLLRRKNKSAVTKKAVA
jgi:hypothetical protein